MRAPWGPPRARVAGLAVLGFTVVLATLSVLLVSPQGAWGKRPDFVSVRGTQFRLHGKPFYFVGANLNVMHGPRARALADATIAAAAKDGLKVGRVWALGEGRADASAWQRAHTLFRAGPAGWQEAAFAQLDRVLVSARRHGVRLIITLSNRWGDYGGVPMYLRWAGRRDRQAYGFADRFYSLPGPRKRFLAHLRRVVSRVNRLTGVAYRDDPTIFAWELQNELHGTPEAGAARRAWVVAMARELRRLDANHLIVPGTLGYFLRHQRRPWLRMCQLPEVAYCDQHIYPEEHAQARSPAALRRFVDDRVQLAHYVAKKPIVFGEFGFADGRGASRANRRARRHGALLRRLFADGGNGALVWIYQPTLHWRRRYGVLVDRRRYTGLRRVLARAARRVARTTPRLQNRRLGPDKGDRLLAPTHVLERGWRGVHRRWGKARRRASGAPPRHLVPRPAPAPRPSLAGCQRLEVPVDRYARSYFEEVGSWGGGVLVHAYGRRSGWIEYRFAGPRFRPRRLVLRLRLSSEYPGSVAPRHGRSLVELSIDGQAVARVIAPPDDGRGRWFEVPVTLPKLLLGLRRGVHRLRVSVPDGPGARGVAIYGREARDNREPVAAPGPLSLLACRP